MKNSLFVDTVNISCKKIQAIYLDTLQYSDVMRPEQKERFKKQVCECIDSL